MQSKHFYTIAITLIVLVGVMIGAGPKEVSAAQAAIINGGADCACQDWKECSDASPEGGGVGTCESGQYAGCKDVEDDGCSCEVGQDACDTNTTGCPFKAGGNNSDCDNCGG